MSEVKFKNQLPIQLRFNDIDIIGHVNNSVYFNFLDLGKTAYFEAVRGEHFDWSNINIVIRNIQADFVCPTFYKDKIAVETAVVKIGNKSMHMFQQIVDIETRHVKCTCTTVMVGFDPKTNQSTEITQCWKDSIREYEENPEL